ncbi:interferon gamma receptor 2 [Puntigrus tetrazona]|uniref:interferon gamma receptor 2 n=1 Tax=Puntigrus tetrazona TaxID=1606681 RepID=UPI001C8A7CDC|nr:interferon gamma receptor 2 [Puntigrus tetrazona]
MIRHICVRVVLTLLINIEGAFSINPPQDVKIVPSNLQWKKPPDDDDGFLYSLQYKPASETDDEWYNVTSHNGTELKFRITPKFNGAVFRVRAEKGSDVSEWQYSKPVQCANTDSCVPVLKLSVKPEMVYLTLAHVDESLEKEDGEHVAFNVSFWKVNNGKYSEARFIITRSKNEHIFNLESGQNYCFQVQYSLYEKPYGNISNQICAIIPETPEAIKSRALIFSIIMSFLVTVMCGVCIFLLFKHHKKLKQLLQPLRLEIPDHYREFFISGEFPLQACPSPSSQSLRSYDMITVIKDDRVE